MARLNVVKSFRGTTKTEDGNLTCERCREKIRKGDGYRWWANRLPGQRSSYRRIRCMNPECHPTIADLTPGRRGQLMQIQQDADKQIWAWDGEIEDLTGIAESVADEIREMAEELRESAQNIEDGFGHATSTSDELNERGDAMEGYADEIADCDFDDPPEFEDFEDNWETCVVCNGEGEIVVDEDEDGNEERETCEECGGSGEVKDDDANRDAFNEALDDWREDQRQKLSDAVNEADVY